MKTENIVFVCVTGLFLLLVAGVAADGMRQARACHARGGELVRTTSGNRCVRVEDVP